MANETALVTTTVEVRHLNHNRGCERNRLSRAASNVGIDTALPVTATSRFGLKSPHCFVNFRSCDRTSTNDYERLGRAGICHAKSDALGTPMMFLWAFA